MEKNFKWNSLEKFLEMWIMWKYWNFWCRLMNFKQYQWISFYRTCWKCSFFYVRMSDGVFKHPTLRQSVSHIFILVNFSLQYNLKLLGKNGLILWDQSTAILIKVAYIGICQIKGSLFFSKQKNIPFGCYAYVVTVYSKS